MGASGRLQVNGFLNDVDFKRFADPCRFTRLDRPEMDSLPRQSAFYSAPPVSSLPPDRRRRIFFLPGSSAAVKSRTN